MKDLHSYRCTLIQSYTIYRTLRDQKGWKFWTRTIGRPDGCESGSVRERVDLEEEGTEEVRDLRDWRSGSGLGKIREVRAGGGQIWKRVEDSRRRWSKKV